jgi:hypothetical protein
MHELKLAHFPVIHSMSLATPPVPDALGNSKGVICQDLDVLLHCHCNLQWQCQGRYFSSGGGILRGSNSALEESERVEKDSYRVLLDYLSGLSLRVRIGDIKRIFH